MGIWFGAVMVCGYCLWAGGVLFGDLGWGRLFARGAGGFLFGDFVAARCLWMNPPLRIDLPTGGMD